MRLAALLICLSALSYEGSSQTITSEDLTKIKGTWMGHLIYTDYSNDQTQVKLETNLVADWKKNSGLLVFEYIEPNGKVVRGKQKIKLGKNSSQFYMDGEWRVIDFQKTEANWKLMLEKVGKDNNRDAVIQQELQVSAVDLTIVKSVKYAGTDQFFVRNRYEFKR